LDVLAGVVAGVAVGVGDDFTIITGGVGTKIGLLPYDLPLIVINDPKVVLFLHSVTVESLDVKGVPVGVSVGVLVGALVGFKISTQKFDG
jgi:hypothetical protein